MKLSFKKEEVFKEIDELKIKELKLFTSIDAQYCTLGCTVSYTRVPNGLIRTIINNEAMSQQFIPIENSYFIV